MYPFYILSYKPFWNPWLKFLFCLYNYFLKGGDLILVLYFSPVHIEVLYFSPLSLCPIICVLFSPGWIIENGKSIYDWEHLLQCFAVLFLSVRVLEFNLTGIKYALFPVRNKVLTIISNQRREHSVMKVRILLSLPLEILSPQGQNTFLRKHQGE